MGTPLLKAGILTWAVVAAAVSLAGLGGVNDDAKALVATATVVGVSCALAAATLIGRGSARAAGVALVVSAIVTPTYFAYAVALPVLGAGLVLAVRPRLLTRTVEEPRVV